ncbi:MAG TPA: RNA polymerase sigma factor [Steroidobacteraceae bacterium]|nr:RNA polymerase sigma factor [Steroidobacteraceae bacterium]
MDFSGLYQRYAPDVYRFALYLTGQRSDAEDITAETFARVWTSSVPLEMVTVKAYLFTIARNLYRQGLRGKSRHVELDEGLQDPRSDPFAEVAQEERLQNTMVALQQLPEISRSALLMYALDGMPYEQISQVLKLSLPAVKVKIHRARLALAGISNEL